ncbi:MAG TPA: leucyl aminopeptidase [Bdellovibrionales bacterium]|nr:leucyl aminopeptidase [Pseudobdellovibrionaceae bacterium]HAG91965.1 leucyl aminopeptidase [Bdellovibrionales bacterium]|tara:strand:+ start:28427 stop:29944 length:1518 start_codon:yes stop_codon:yes gene_type:complete
MSHKVLVSVSKKSSKGSTLVVFVSKSTGKNSLSHPKLSKDIADILKKAQSDEIFTGGKKETLFFRGANVDGFDHLLLVGLGDSKGVTGDALRCAAAITLGKIKAEKVSQFEVLAASVTHGQKDSAEAVQAFAEGLLLSAYEYDDLKSKDSDKKSKKPSEIKANLGFDQAPSAAQKKALERAEIISECQNFGRRLGDAPGNYMTPTMLANEAVKAAKGTKLKVTVWDKARIKKERLNGLYFVSKGSAEDPRFIILEYKGNPSSKKHVAFVGKGLTFDCGGISIKPSAGMEEMKYDMCGGANVIATLLAIAKLGLKINVTGYVPSTENLAGSAANKPGDVYVARNGKSVEIFNTDAEGRLILSDSLVYACEKKPAAIFDIATLTGAILISLGNHYTGVFTRDQKLMKTVQDSADKAGELVWNMPLDDFHVEDMKGNHADLCNISGNRLAGSSTAAAFLEQFVDKEIPWAHFDIAGTGWNVNNRFPYHPKKGASGAMIRTFIELAQKV